MRLLRQSTSVDVPVGPFLDTADGFTPLSGLTITQPDIRLKKNGGAWAQKAAAQTLAHEENGYYEVTLDATDTATLGLLRLAVNETGALPVWEEFMIMPANVWDSLFGADVLQVDLLQIGGDAQSSTDLKDFADAGYDPATNKVQGVVLVDTLTTYTGNTPQTGDSFARLGLPAGASVSADLAAIEAQTDDIGAAGAGLTAIPTIATVTAVTTVNGLAANVITATSIAANAFTAAKFASGAFDAVWTVATRELTAFSTALALSVWHVLEASIVTASTIGLKLKTNLDAAISGRASQTSVDDLPTNAELATALGTADDATLAAIAALNNLSQANIRTAVGLGSANLDTQLDALPTAAELATALGTADDAVLAAIAALPTLAQMAANYPGGAVVTDGGNTALTFKTNLTAASDGTWADAYCLFLTGNLAGQVKRVTAFVAATDFLTVHAVYTTTPANGDTFLLINR